MGKKKWEYRMRIMKKSMEKLNCFGVVGSTLAFVEMV